MDAVEELLATEGIRRVQARYWVCMDTKDWAGLRSVFTDTAVFDLRGERAFALGEDPGQLEPVEVALRRGDPSVLEGGETIANFIRDVVGPWTTVHHGHAPVIEVLGADRGRAIWPMFDYIDDGERAMRGYGHYHVDYRRDGAEWRIDLIQLNRIRADGEHPGRGEL